VGGAPEKALALPNARILIPSRGMSGLGGQATDIDLHAKEICEGARRSIRSSQHSGQAVEKIERTWSALHHESRTGQGYGMIDEIISSISKADSSEILGRKAASE